MFEILYLAIIVGIVAVIRHFVETRRVVIVYTAFAVVDGLTTMMFMFAYAGGTPMAEGNPLVRALMTVYGVPLGIFIFLVVSVGLVWELLLLSDGTLDKRLVISVVMAGAYTWYLHHPAWLLVIIWLPIYLIGLAAGYKKNAAAEFPIIVYAAFLGGAHIEGAASWVAGYWLPVLQSLPVLSFLLN